jgi:di/tricarboxylate transporter
MNEEMQKQLGKILELMISGLEKAGDVASKELPGLLEDYLQFFIIDLLPVSQLVYIIGVLILIYTTKEKIRKWYEHVKKNSYDTFDFWMPFGIASIIMGIFFIVAVLSVADTSKEIAQIYVAPKAYIIEKLRK